MNNNTGTGANANTINNSRFSEVHPIPANWFTIPNINNSGNNLENNPENVTSENATGENGASVNLRQQENQVLANLQRQRISFINSSEQANRRLFQIFNPNHNSYDDRTSNASALVDEYTLDQYNTLVQGIISNFKDKCSQTLEQICNKFHTRHVDLLEKFKQDNQNLKDMQLEVDTDRRSSIPTLSPEDRVLKLQDIKRLANLQKTRIRLGEMDMASLKSIRQKYEQIIDNFSREFAQKFHGIIENDNQFMNFKTLINKYLKEVYALKYFKATNNNDLGNTTNIDIRTPTTVSFVSNNQLTSNTLNGNNVHHIGNFGFLSTFSNGSNLVVNNDDGNATANIVPEKKKFPLNKVPLEIMGLILERINKKSELVMLLPVCRAWAEIIVKIIYYRPQLDKKHQLDAFMETMVKLGSQTVFDYRFFIKRLNFSFVADHITDEKLLHFTGCPNLERLTLVFCRNVTSSSISSVLTNCTYLQSVDVTGVKQINDNIFNTLAYDCQRVQGFYVPQASLVSYDALDTFITHATYLKRIKITANKRMNDELVEKMAHMCPLLVEVDISDSPNVHDESLLVLFSKLSQLREFRITHNTNVSDKLFLDLYKYVKHLPALRLVDISACENITDKGIEKLVDMSPKLRNAFLGKCSKITDRSLFALSKLGKNLQTLHFGHCYNITDRGVQRLTSRCIRLQYVDFACCIELTNKSLYELADLPKLKRIGLVKCSQITDEGLLNMVSMRGRNDTLERVHLSYCTNLSIYPIYELLMACPRLSHLSLTAIPSFLRPDITTFCRAPPSDFSENQRQIFCVFSGKGVQRLRHYLMSIITPTSSPQTSIKEVLLNYLYTYGLCKNGETPNEALERLSIEVDQESVAILTAAQASPFTNASLNNENELQNMNFERLEEVFGAFHPVPQDALLTTDLANQLVLQLDHEFVDNPLYNDFDNSGSSDESNGNNFYYHYDDPVFTVAPGASRQINMELCEIVRKIALLQKKIADFEVNVASISRVQFQFAGCLINTMVSIYNEMHNLNRKIARLQSSIYSNGSGIDNERDLIGIAFWRFWWRKKIFESFANYRLSTVALRLYLKENIAALTRYREISIARYREQWNETNGDNLVTNNDNNTNDNNNTNNSGNNSIQGDGGSSDDLGSISTGLEGSGSGDGNPGISESTEAFNVELARRLRNHRNDNGLPPPQLQQQPLVNIDNTQNMSNLRHPFFITRNQYLVPDETGTIIERTFQSLPLPSGGQEQQRLTGLGVTMNNNNNNSNNSNIARVSINTNNVSNFTPNSAPIPITNSNDNNTERPATQTETIVPDHEVELINRDVDSMMED
ncbi:related to SCF E3 ubiquitin ligase complex F-box protein GRR1 [Saccharomycodes ludwigii]|uniref:Related to SCF E3 ubiquitin ligase complex F-box protein GRR1 n=2 Tax=Saccharomycodes ludwigii TaxID=36035 RepID=A0A376B6M4_9ASCO|nr:related to SCF E3 ubiquitin ligase complex F-box protein GRR1 [Saccharomycodes ludwigii]